jgi:uncharacterized protein
MEHASQRKVLSALCHGSIFFSGLIVPVAIPIIILFTTEDSVVKANAKESLNFHINIFIYAFMFVLLIVLLIGIPLLILLGAFSFIMPIIAIVRVAENPEKPYRYPFLFRLV